MLNLRRAHERGHADHGWLDSYHTFSFAGYHDPAHMGFRALRVINEDRVAPGQGFDTHPHRDMEILTYMIAGRLAHKDSMGNGRVIEPGEVQGMSAGTGITHSEYNPSETEPVHLLQIWIVPHTKNVTPRYAEWRPTDAPPDAWALTASESGEGGSIPIHQDARMYVASLSANASLSLPIAARRYGWLQVATGAVALNGTWLAAGDGVSFKGGDLPAITASSESKLLLFDLA